jgi:hypothetical protein
VTEVTCKHCGRQILSFGNDPLVAQETCASCHAVPGWFHDPELAQRIDPDCMRNPPNPQ